MIPTEHQAHRLACYSVPLGKGCLGLAHAEHLGATVLPETEIIHKRAEARNQPERPPSHKRPGLNDCRIWEQCLALLAAHNVVFVSGDGDFVVTVGPTSCIHSYKPRPKRSVQGEA